MFGVFTTYYGDCTVFDHNLSGLGLSFRSCINLRGEAPINVIQAAWFSVILAGRNPWKITCEMMKGINRISVQCKSEEEEEEK